MKVRYYEDVSAISQIERFIRHIIKAVPDSDGADAVTAVGGTAVTADVDTAATPPLTSYHERNIYSNIQPAEKTLLNGVNTI